MEEPMSREEFMEFKKEMSARFDKLDSCLLGNGKLGLVVRTDRLEQWQSLSSKILWSIVGIFVSLVGSFLFLFATGKASLVVK